MNPYLQLISAKRQSSICKYIIHAVFFIVLLAVVYQTQAAEKKGCIVLIDDGSIYIDLGKKHEVEEGMLFRVYRQEKNEQIDIAIVKANQVLTEASIVSVVSQESDREIRVKDMAEIVQDTENILKNEKKSAGKSPNDVSLSQEPENQPPNFKNKENNICRLLLGTGIALLGGASYFHQSANSAYNKYKQANSSEMALSFREDTQLNDKRTKIALGISFALIGISVYLWKDNNMEKQNLSINSLNSPLKNNVYNEIKLTVKF